MIESRSVTIALLLSLAACAAPHGAHGDTGWYEFEWLASSPYAPRFAVLDTESSLGPYATRAKTITLGDLVRMHGHACDGLVVAAAALSLALDELYPDGVIDRTDTGCITNNSPCFGDVAAYLTGGRIRFGTQKVDPARGISFLVYRFSTGGAIEVRLRDGVFPAELGALEDKVRGASFSAAELRACQLAQWEFARELLQRPLRESFETQRRARFQWRPDAYENAGERGDIRNRNALPGAHAAGDGRANQPTRRRPAPSPDVGPRPLLSDCHLAFLDPEKEHARCPLHPAATKPARP